MPQPRCVRMCTQIQYHFFDLPFKEYRATEDSARRSVRTRLFVGGLAENLLLGLLQLDNLPTLIGKSQLMAEPFASANDGLSLPFAFLVELVDILDRAPVGDMACLAFPEEAVQHPAAGQQTNVAFMKRRHRPASHFLVLAYQDAAGVLHCNR